MARVFSRKHRRRARLYQLIGVDPDADQTWQVYLRSVLAFSLVSVLFLYAFQRLQHHLLLSLGFPPVKPARPGTPPRRSSPTPTGSRTPASRRWATSSRWPASRCRTSPPPPSGMAVAVALVRGFARSRTDRLGNFWVDLIRGMPAHPAAALLRLRGGAAGLRGRAEPARPAHGHHPGRRHQSITGGPVACQEAIKELGTNGGGFYNANSAHPFENPNPFTNWWRLFLLLIPFSLPRTFGRLIGDLRQGYAILAAMAVIWVVVTVGDDGLRDGAPRRGTDGGAAAMEGKEVRFGVPGSTLFACSTTLTSTGAVNSFHDSFTPLGGGIAILDMMTGEVAPGGVGSGLYGILVLAVVAVFVAGLMVGRTPEYLGKKIGPRR